MILNHFRVNRRISFVGELLQNQYRIGLSVWKVVVRERMSIQDMATVSHHNN